jgi:sugar lactone lactonase YvrE
MHELTTRVLRKGLGFGEGPRWHDHRLWFSDFYRHAIFSVSEDGEDERVEHEVATQPSGLGWHANGDLVYVSMTDHRLMRVSRGDTSELADLSEYCGFWANDLAVSSSDVSYVGNFGFDLDELLREATRTGNIPLPLPTTNLVVLDANGEVLQVVPDMAFPNGTVLTPDGTTLIVAETVAYRLSAFDVLEDGALTNRRVWADLGAVAPDGICLDAEGQIWVANPLADECLRVREGGEITARATTTQRAFACMLGGATRSTLYVMCAPTSDRFEIADKREGTLEAVAVSVPGAGRP